MNFFELIKKFPTEEKAIKHFMNTRYDIVICPHCGSHKVYRRKDQPKLFACKECNNSFSIFKGTIFEKSSTDIRKWFYAISTFLNAKKGISACQLQRETEVTYKTAWRMLKQIRLAMSNMEINKFMNAIVEIDEFKSYNILESKDNFIHFIVNHSSGEYSDNNGVHTNSIESFWATLKRGVYGIYHHVSLKYLQNYVNEFCFRYNYRHFDMFNLVLRQAVIG